MAKFKFRLPKKLTVKQERAIDSMKPIFLTGVPGAGKTVVATMRLKNSNNGILFTYGKLLSKAIEGQVNDDSKKVVNVHKWLYDITKEYLETSLSDVNLDTTIKHLKLNNINFEEIIVDEGQDLLPNSYKLFRELTNSLSVGADDAQRLSSNEFSSEKDILSIIGDVREIELDENFRNSYKIFNFARQFVPNNPRAHKEEMLDKLIKDSGNTPVIYKVENLDKSFEVINKIIASNPTDNIGVLCENQSAVDIYASELKKQHEISVYHSKLEIPTKLNNILVTTIKSAKGMEFDIVIVPKFQNITNRNNELYFVAATRAKTELYMICDGYIPKTIIDFDEDTYKIIEYKG